MKSSHLEHINDYIHDDTGDNLDMLYDAIKVLATEGDLKNCNIVRTKLANLYLDYKNYSKALVLYNTVINTSEINADTKNSLEECIFCAFLCKFLLGYSYDTIITDLNEYLSYFVSFKFSAKYRLLLDITEAIKSRNVNKFSASLQDYNKNMALHNPVIVSALLTIKTQIIDEQVDSIKQIQQLEKINSDLANELIELKCTKQEFKQESKQEFKQESNLSRDKDLIDFDQPKFNSNNLSFLVNNDNVEKLAELVAEKILSKLSDH
jgi:hypothetical protein